MVVKTWKFMTNEEKKTYFDTAAKINAESKKLQHIALNERLAQSNQIGKCTPLGTSRTINDFQIKQMGKREHKPKVHFDMTNLGKSKEGKTHKKQHKKSFRVNMVVVVVAI
ncbi:uncharacterized protein LOC114915415 [Cajanus cajan]|uniref:uncharacterized protein LOC114915415 n=1 Tax=Cajanus cajan TaxID=3821 RepID=UPI0010FB1D56|nr:uncharacterized protein LOC114915415 [Cajanus cajan]